MSPGRWRRLAWRESSPT